MLSSAWQGIWLGCGFSISAAVITGCIAVLLPKHKSEAEKTREQNARLLEIREEQLEAIEVIGRHVQRIADSAEERTAKLVAERIRAELAGK